MPKLKGKRVAVLVEDGFEQMEMTSPVERLRKEGAEVDIISPKSRSEKVRSWHHGDWSREFDIDKSLQEANVDNYDALVLPGGVINPDRLRRNREAVSFVRNFFDTQKPVAAICHGPWTLIEADIVRGRKVTSYESLKTDLRNAGATWVDEEVVVDQGLVTSRKPEDLPAFNDKLVEEVAEGQHKRRQSTVSAS